MATKRPPAAPAPPVSLKLDSEEQACLNSLSVARKRSSRYLTRETVHKYLTREEARQ